MRRRFSILVLLLAAVMIAASAILPQIVAGVQDGITMGKVRYDMMQSVQLEIQQDIPSLGKLALMSRLDGVIEIAEEDALLTPEEVEEYAYAALEPYLEAGLMEPLEKWRIETRCLLGQAPDDPKLNAIFWTVTIVGDPDVYYVVDLAIDDETGNLLRIDFTSNYPIAETIREEYLYAFSDIYFRTLEIYDYADYATTDLEEEYIGGNACGIRYRFGDLVYGEINVDFYVYEYGFHTELYR